MLSQLYLAQQLLVLAIYWLATRAAAIGFSDHAEDLLKQSMDFMDRNYDEAAGYQFNLGSALLHETRSSSWYAAGLLARNEGEDVLEAVQIINNIISGQFQNASEQWYGDYQTYPEQPSPGTEAYPAKIYKTWDPNWRGFIGTAFIVILEEYGHLLPSEVEEQIIKSLHLSAIGDTYRVGGVDDDNLYPAYSNAAIMHAVVSSYVGRRAGDANLTAEGESWGRDIVELFDRNGTLSEFNGPTYVGVSLFALTLCAKYLPEEDAVLGANAGRMIREIWDLTGELYNANLKNIAPPWDRSYGYDMNRYLSIMALWIWTLVGLDQAPLYNKPWAVAHVDDFQIGPLVAILADYHKQFVNEEVMRSLTRFDEPRFVRTSAHSPPYDISPRNITAWLAANLTIGAESFDENVVGGPSINPQQFNPAVVQWLRKDGTVGFLSLWPEVQALQVEVSEHRLALWYPKGNSTSTFTLHVSTNGLVGPKNVRSWSDVEGVRVRASGTVDPKPSVSFCGINGGDCDPVNDFDLWNFTYSMPPGSTSTPRLVLNIELK